MTREEHYDTAIAPKLLEVAKLCEDWDMPFIAEVWYDGDAAGETVHHPDGPRAIAWQLTRAAARAKGNLDLLVFAMARKFPDGGSSCVLRMLKTEPR